MGSGIGYPSSVSRARSADRDDGARRATGLCAETQGREVMAKLVHDVVAEAMRLDLYDAPPSERVSQANGARFGRRNKVRNG